MFFIPISNMAKRYSNLGHRGVKFEKYPKLYFKIPSYITSKVELLWLIKTQLEVTGIQKLTLFQSPKLEPNEIFRSYIIRFEVILQVKLSYFRLSKDN